MCATELELCWGIPRVFTQIWHGCEPCGPPHNTPLPATGINITGRLGDTISLSDLKDVITAHMCTFLGQNGCVVGEDYVSGVVSCDGVEPHNFIRSGAQTFGLGITRPTELPPFGLEVDRGHTTSLDEPPSSGMWKRHDSLASANATREHMSKCLVSRSSVSSNPQSDEDRHGLGRHVTLPGRQARGVHETKMDDWHVIAVPDDDPPEQACFLVKPELKV